jgi:hypothetical protein
MHAIRSHGAPEPLDGAGVSVCGILAAGYFCRTAPIIFSYFPMMRSQR